MYGVIQDPDEIMSKRRYRSIKYLEQLAETKYGSSAGVVNCVALRSIWECMSTGKDVGKLRMGALKAGKSFEFTLKQFHVGISE